MSENQLQELMDAVMKIQKEWLDPNELEAEFGILKSTQSKMRMAKKLPYHKIGKYIRYHRPDINQLLMEAKVV